MAQPKSLFVRPYFAGCMLVILAVLLGVLALFHKHLRIWQNGLTISKQHTSSLISNRSIAFYALGRPTSYGIGLTRFDCNGKRDEEFSKNLEQSGIRERMTSVSANIDTKKGIRLWALSEKQEYRMIDLTTPGKLKSVAKPNEQSYKELEVALKRPLKIVDSSKSELSFANESSNLAIVKIGPERASEVKLFVSPRLKDGRINAIIRSSKGRIYFGGTFYECPDLKDLAKQQDQVAKGLCLRRGFGMLESDGQYNRKFAKEWAAYTMVSAANCQSKTYIGLRTGLDEIVNDVVPNLSLVKFLPVQWHVLVSENFGFLILPFS